MSILKVLQVSLKQAFNINLRDKKIKIKIKKAFVLLMLAIKFFIFFFKYTGFKIIKRKINVKNPLLI